LQQTLIAGQDCQVSPLGADVPFGALVSGLTLEHLQDQAARKALFDLWVDRGVLVFRGENTSEMHVALSRVFGALERHVFKETWVDGFPELVKIKYYPDDGTLYEVDGKVLGGWLPWHSDLVYTDTINHGGVLRAMQLPPTGGLTGFIDQIAAYERLPQRLQDKIEDLHVVYVMDLNAERQRYGREVRAVPARGQVLPADHGAGIPVSPHPAPHGLPAGGNRPEGAERLAPVRPGRL
jgi:taurine dioxygenase